jgi:hypothetical protein
MQGAPPAAGVSEPAFSLNNEKYREPYVSHRLQAPFYVKSKRDFDKRYPSGSRERLQLELQVRCGFMPGDLVYVCTSSSIASACQAVLCCLLRCDLCNAAPCVVPCCGVLCRAVLCGAVLCCLALCGAVWC